MKPIPRKLEDGFKTKISYNNTSTQSSHRQFNNMYTIASFIRPYCTFVSSQYLNLLSKLGLNQRQQKDEV